MNPFDRKAGKRDLDQRNMVFNGDGITNVQKHISACLRLKKKSIARTVKKQNASFHQIFNCNYIFISLRYRVTKLNLTIPF
jgi:hypothetical protein